MPGNSNYKELLGWVESILASPGTRDEKLQAICSLLEKRVDHYHWVGIYLAHEAKGELVLGPYVGEPTEHVRIPFGEGICGRAAETLETLVAQDVSKESNYLSCSVNVKSEMVIPIFKDGVLRGELDIDSHTISPFSEEDIRCLEQICALIAQIL